MVRTQGCRWYKTPEIEHNTCQIKCVIKRGPTEGSAEEDPTLKLGHIKKHSSPSIGSGKYEPLAKKPHGDRGNLIMIMNNYAWVEYWEVHKAIKSSDSDITSNSDLILYQACFTSHILLAFELSLWTKRVFHYLQYQKQKSPVLWPTRLQTSTARQGGWRQHYCFFLGQALKGRFFSSCSQIPDVSRAVEGLTTLLETLHQLRPFEHLLISYVNCLWDLEYPPLVWSFR